MTVAPPLDVVLTWPTPRQMAEKLGVTVTAVRLMIRRGDIEAVRVGPRRIRIDPDSVRVVPLSATVPQS